MPKLLWAALPLLLAAAWVGMQALRGRRPSRHALNVGSSVLLLAYLLTTAGLGIFWVANQQLPVFDWHYLFGYATVLLVAVHLVFNFRVVWRYLRRRPADAPVRTAGSAPGRRGALGLLGAALAGGVALTLGLRQGRSPPQADGLAAARGAGGVDPAAGGVDRAAAPSASALALVERFHALSSHSRAGVFLRAPGTDWGEPPPPFKPYPGAVRTALPRPGRLAGASFDMGALGAVLWHAAGVSEVRGGLQLRTSPSSGALFPSELYVIVRAVPGLPPGPWHYDPGTHALERLAIDVDAGQLGLEGGAAPHDTAAAIVVATAVFRRTGHKYRDRTYRYVLADLGHALENLRVAGAAAGATLHPLATFDDARTAAALGLDEAEEGVLALAALQPGAGKVERPAPAQASRWQTPALAREPPADPGVTSAIHAATSLRAIAPRPAQAQRPPSDAAPLPAGAVTLPQVALSRSDVLQVIATRRSVRRFARTPLPLDALAAVLLRMTEPGPAWSAAVRIDVVVHAVDALAPGSYRCDPAQRALLPRRAGVDLRDAARAAALDQDVMGEGAVAIVLSIDRSAFAADPLGAARGYRHAFLEAGLVGERIYLEAVARGLGACAVGAFYDDEAAALVGIDPAREWVVHFAALGVPAR